MADATLEPRAQFHEMKNGTREDWMIIATSAAHYSSQLPDRILAHMRLLDGAFDGYSVDRLTHSLQTATRAQLDGRDEEYVMCALLHDIGDTLGCFNHADIAGSVLKPFVSEQNLWMVEHHAVFQGYYFFEHLGLDKNMREQFREHPYFDCTEEFCEKYDQNSFDPAYESQPLESFEPILRKLMKAPRRSIYIRK